MRRKLIELGVIAGTAIGAVSCASSLEIFPFLEQRCKTEDVAKLNLILHPNESAVVGSGEFFRNGTRISFTNDGIISINKDGSLNNEPGPELLPDGRIGLTVVRGTVFDKNPKVAIKTEPKGKNLDLTFEMNCADRTIYPK